MSEIMQELRKAILSCGRSRYAIAQETGIAESQLSRLMSGERNLSVQTAERLAANLGLDITVRPRRGRKGK